MTGVESHHLTPTYLLWESIPDTSSPVFVFFHYPSFWSTFFVCCQGLIGPWGRGSCNQLPDTWALGPRPPTGRTRKDAGLAGVDFAGGAGVQELVWNLGWAWAKPGGRGGRDFSTSESARGRAGLAGPGAGRGGAQETPAKARGHARWRSRWSGEPCAVGSRALPCAGAPAAQVQPAAASRRAPSSVPSTASTASAAASAPRSARMARAVPENGGARERRPGRGGRVPACRLPVPGAPHRVAAQFQVRIPGLHAPPFSPD